MLSPSRSAKRRPVDALFGESVATVVAPTFLVEPPQPVTTVSPPMPEALPTAEIAVPPPPAADALPSETLASVPGELVEEMLPLGAPSERIAEAPPAPEMAAFTPPMSKADVGMALSPTAEASLPDMASLQAEAEYALGMSERITRLYDDVKADLAGSPAIGDHCLETLKQARAAYLKCDYAAAEFYVQSVDARLKRNVRSVRASRSPVVWVLWLWELTVFGICSSIVAISFIVNLTLFGLPVAPELVVLLRTFGWGGIGGVLGAMFKMPWRVQSREYDPADNMDYFARPLKGIAIGGLFFLLAQVGILGTSLTLPREVPVGPVFLYLFTVLAGFKQEYVGEFFDGVMKAIFRAPKPPPPPQG